MYKYYLSLAAPYTHYPRNITRPTNCNTNIFNISNIFNLLYKDEFWLYFNKISIHINR